MFGDGFEIKQNHNRYTDERNTYQLILSSLACMGENKNNRSNQISISKREEKFDRMIIVSGYKTKNESLISESFLCCHTEKSKQFHRVILMMEKDMSAWVMVSFLLHRFTLTF